MPPGVIYLGCDSRDEDAADASRGEHVNSPLPPEKQLHSFPSCPITSTQHLTCI